MHSNLLERWESKKYFGFNLLAQSAAYANTLAKILSIFVPLGDQSQEQSHLISLTGLQKLDNLLNKIKYRSLEILNHLFRYLFEKVHNSVKVQSPFLQRAIQFCPFLIKNLLIITGRADIEVLVLDEAYSDVLVEAIETLVLFSAEKEFQDNLVSTSRALLVGVGLALMRTSK